MGRKITPKHPQEPDAVYNDVIVGKFIRCLMKRGKRTLAESIFYGAMDVVKDKIKDKEPVDVFRTAIANAMPVLEVKSRRVGGATYQVPVEIRTERRQALAFRWLLGFAEDRKGQPMFQKLAAELMDAASGQGATIKKKEDTHKMAEANKAFSHYKW